MTRRVLLDISRSVRRKWSGATPSGIDRVCDAYAGHFADRAHAVLQLRGRLLVLDRVHSARLFAALTGERAVFRSELARVLISHFLTGAVRPGGSKADGPPIYLNVSHSGFDRDVHWRAIQGLGAQSVYLIHDLIPVRHPEFTTAHKVTRHRQRVEHALCHASGIITASRLVADDVRDFARSSGLPIPPMLTVPIAGAALPREPIAQLQRHPLFVAIGTIEARKNYETLLHAWSALIDRMGPSAPHLMIVGSWGVRSATMRAALRADPRLDRFVAVRSGLDDAQIGHLMAQVRAVLFPSLAEGFGLPLVEALQHGAPVIASDLPIFRELGQSIPTFVQPSDAVGWAQHIAQFCGDSPERERQIALLPCFVPHRWEDHFRQVDGWLEQLGAQHAPASANRLHSAGAAPRLAAIPPCAAGANAIYTQLRDPVGREQELQC